MLLRITFSLKLFLISITVSSQSGSWTSTDFPGSQFIGLYEINNKLYGAVGNTFLGNLPVTAYELLLYEIDHQGNSSGLFLEEIKRIQYPDKFITIAIDYIEDEQKWISFQGSFVESTKLNYRAIRYDQNFNIIDSQSITAIGTPAIFHIDFDKDRTYILGSFQSSPENKLIYLNADHSFPLPPISLSLSEPATIWFITSMEVDDRTGNLLLFCYGGIAILDSNLNQIHVYNPFEIGTGRHGDVIGIGEHYYSHGSTFHDGGVLVLQKYDTLFKVLASDTFGIRNQDNYPYINKSIEFRNDEILCGGHLTGPLNHLDFAAAHKKIYLAKFDSYLNRKWYKEYGGDKGYILQGLHLMDNGTCFAYGYVTDSLNVRYAYLLHVDQNGDVINEHQIPNIYHPTIKVINPGERNLTVLNPEDLEAEITLYAMDGKELFRSLLGPGTQEFSLPALPPGIYLYMLMRDGKFYGSGKWLKQ